MVYYRNRKFFVTVNIADHWGTGIEINIKLYYDKKSKDPTYYAQHGVCIGNKTTTHNVKKFGKHSELLKITDDPLAYVKEKIRKMNEEEEAERDIIIKIDFNEKLSTEKTEKQIKRNIGYFIIQDLIKELDLKKFFKEIDKDHSFDAYTIWRFIIYDRIIYSSPKSSPFSTDADMYYENPRFTDQDR